MNLVCGLQLHSLADLGGGGGGGGRGEGLRNVHTS